MFQIFDQMLLLTRRTSFEFGYSILQIRAVAFSFEHREQDTVDIVLKYVDQKDVEGDSPKEAMIRFVSWFNGHFDLRPPTVWIGNKNDWKDLQGKSRYFWGSPIAPYVNDYELPAFFAMAGDWPDLGNSKNPDLELVADAYLEHIYNFKNTPKKS